MINKVGFPLGYCRVCKSKDLQKVLSFGPTPLANNFLSEKEKELPESFYPLDVFFCKNCTFLQLGYVVNPRLLFDDYVYVSSTSSVFVDHFVKFSREITKRFNLRNENLVIDIGSNDGILLMPYKNNTIKVLGIEPSVKIADIARKKGITTISEYFSEKLAVRVTKKFGNANVVTATNVFAHIHDLDDVIKGVKKILQRDGVFIIEAPYLVDFISKNYFDLVYHEHLSYWSVKTLTRLFERFGMQLFDVEKVNVHGGSIRVYIQKKEGKFKVEKNVRKFLKIEKEAGLADIQTYKEYEKKILKNKSRLIQLLTSLKLKNKKIAGYGASAKGNTLLNYFKIGNELLEYIVDDSSYKQGLFTPGTRIKVFSPDELRKNQPDYILILAWNFKDSIIKNNSWLEGKSHFIIPAPNPKIIY